MNDKVKRTYGKVANRVKTANIRLHDEIQHSLLTLDSNI